jgi:hypothetical protein
LGSHWQGRRLMGPGWLDGRRRRRRQAPGKGAFDYLFGKLVFEVADALAKLVKTESQVGLLLLEGFQPGLVSGVHIWFLLVDLAGTLRQGGSGR